MDKKTASSPRKPTQPRRQSPLPSLGETRVALVLCAQEVTTGARNIMRLFLPDSWHFPVALFSYLFVIFALEVAFLQAFQSDPPMPPLAVGKNRAEAIAARNLYADMLDVLPSEYENKPPLAQLIGDVAYLFVDPASPGLKDRLTPVEALRNPLMVYSTDEAHAAPFPNIRYAVTRHSVRMPVDKKAFHPLDKASFLAAATTRGTFRRMFAGTRCAEPPEVMLAELPDSAIAPPTTHIDRIRAADTRRRKLGSLSARFESGTHGVFAIGYDIKGGTSYGKYQISSRKGAMREFLQYLKYRAPSWAMRLKESGPSNTGGVYGGMPREWKRIAKESPGLFETLQDDFIHNKYYSPTLRAIRVKAGIDLEDHPKIVQEVLWSTAVLHGPTGGAGIFIRASQRARLKRGSHTAEALLNEVFRERERKLIRCPIQHRSALRARLRQEKNLAMAQLHKTS